MLKKLFYASASMHGTFEVRPRRFPSVPRGRAPGRDTFTPEQAEAVIANLEQPVADLVLALWLTGWRRREVQFLRWVDVDMAAGTLRLTEDRSKTGEARCSRSPRHLGWRR